MKKYSFFSKGIQVEFIPIVNQRLDVIAHEAIMRFDELIPPHEELQFDTFELTQFQVNLDTLYKRLAIKTYKGSVPLLLSASPNQMPHMLPIPKEYELIVTINQPVFLFNTEMTNEHLNYLTGKGVKFALDGFGHKFLSLPFLINLQPKFIKFANEIVLACQDEMILNKLVKLIQPFKEMGIKFIADSIESQEQFDRMQLLADAFEGSWISELMEHRDGHGDESI
ncbi:EAL domain-containing protein [Brevibacillus borstelensis]|uniref:EAL domain-containing protein n=1 Tax=Brevibacillus borstelensis TaxID=45462 RepID=UPI00203A5167|nr:EAL domain-containing protein [Brevibacillus borstelensis]MCM3625497.1 EAL domain-containing protein [Brevibacillus borstelensis]